MPNKDPRITVKRARTSAPSEPVSEKELLKRAPSRFRRRKNGGANIAIVLVSVLLVATLATSVIYIAQLPARYASEKRDSIASELDAVKDADESVQCEFITVECTSDDINRGELILVNYETPYVFPEDDSLVMMSHDKSDSYSVAYNDFMLDETALDAFNDFTDALAAETGEKCLLVNSTYRSLEDQQSTYDSYLASNGEDYVKEYVATPRYSEHHTGLSLDLTIRYADGTYCLMADYEHYDDINALCVNYGFIHRYPTSKEQYTHIAHEPWHYRYVGIPHSYAVTESGLCLEEYLLMLRDYTLDGSLYMITSDGEISDGTLSSLPENGYIVYYVPSAGDVTEISIPKDADSYSISGNNSDGFIVTCTFGTPQLPTPEHVIS